MRDSSDRRGTRQLYKIIFRIAYNVGVGRVKKIMLFVELWQQMDFKQVSFLKRNFAPGFMNMMYLVRVCVCVCVCVCVWGGGGGGGGVLRKFWQGCLCRVFATIPLATETEGQNRTLGYGKWVKIKPLTMENVTKLTTFLSDLYEFGQIGPKILSFASKKRWN